MKRIEKIAAKCTQSQSDGYAKILAICDTIKHEYASDFTEDERMVLSDGILSLIDNTQKAIQYCGGDEVVISHLRERLKYLQKLNDKICTEKED